MAKIETTFIRPKEIFTPDTGKAKVVYDGYQNNPHEIVLQENLEGDVSEVINDTFVANADGNVAFTDSDNVSHELLTAQGLGKAQVIATTWSALKALRDGGNLVAGSLYRITDYVTTTAQENTQSAGHQFDIVLLALSANKLAEEGWAMMNESNIYDVTFNDAVVKCYLYQGSDEGLVNIVDCSTLLGMDDAVLGSEIVVNESNKTAQTNGMLSSDLVDEGIPYNYFQNSKLEAWKIWYCLDNDTDRFAWADDNMPQIYDGDYWYLRDATKDVEDYFAWDNSDEGATLFTKTLTPIVGTPIYEPDGSVNGYVGGIKGFGRGVIYRLIDEWINDLPYDFKNIILQIPMVDGAFDATGEPVYGYTFCSNFDDNDNCTDLSLDGTVVSNNSLKCYIEDGVYSLPDVVFFANGGESSDVFFRGVSIADGTSSFILVSAVNIKTDIMSGCIMAGQSYVYNIGELAELTASDNVSYKCLANGVEVAVVQGD